MSDKRQLRPFKNRHLKPIMVEGLALLDQCLEIAGEEESDGLEPKWLEDVKEYYTAIDKRLQRISGKLLKEESATVKYIRDYVNDPVTYTESVDIDSRYADLIKIVESNKHEICDGLYRALRFLRHCQTATKPNGMFLKDYEDWKDIMDDAVSEINYLKDHTPNRKSVYLGREEIAPKTQ